MSTKKKKATWDTEAKNKQFMTAVMAAGRKTYGAAFDDELEVDLAHHVAAMLIIDGVDSHIRRGDEYGPGVSGFRRAAAKTMVAALSHSIVGMEGGEGVRWFLDACLRRVDEWKAESEYANIAEVHAEMRKGDTNHKGIREGNRKIKKNGSKGSAVTKAKKPRKNPILHGARP